MMALSACGKNGDWILQSLGNRKGIHKCFNGNLIETCTRETMPSMADTLKLISGNVISKP